VKFRNFALTVILLTLAVQIAQAQTIYVESKSFFGEKLPKDVEINITVQGLENCTGIQLNLTFDSHIADLVNFTLSAQDFDVLFNWSTSGENFLKLFVVLDNTTINESKFVKILFRVKKYGCTPLNLTEVRISTSEFQSREIEIINGSVMVTVKGDFNGNIEVDIGDVAYVAYMVIGKVPQDVRADFNGNGRVDIGDLAKIAHYLLRKIDEL